MKVILYARVSTEDKDQDPERQLMKLREYANFHTHIILGELIDHCTGDSKPLDRPAGKCLLDKNPDAILFYSMDRFTRQHPIKVLSLINELKDRGVKIVSITEPAFNMETEFSDIFIYILTWFNNYFLTKLKRDIRSGMERARIKGKHIGRARATFNKELAYELLFEKNLSQRKVAGLLNTSLATINRFKKDIEKNNGSYISHDHVSNPPGSGTIKKIEKIKEE